MSVHALQAEHIQKGEEDPMGHRFDKDATPCSAVKSQVHGSFRKLSNRNLGRIHPKRLNNKILVLGASSSSYGPVGLLVPPSTLQRYPSWLWEQELWSQDGKCHAHVSHPKRHTVLAQACQQHRAVPLQRPALLLMCPG